jgi:hypothetical protein
VEDAYLPGRNGMSFSLTRTYNSQDAQFDEMTIEESKNYSYKVEAPIELVKKQKFFKASTVMRKYSEFDYDCDGLVDKSYSSEVVESIISKQYSSKSGAMSHDFPSSHGSWSDAKGCGGGIINSEPTTSQVEQNSTLIEPENSPMNKETRQRFSYHADKPYSILEEFTEVGSIPGVYSQNFSHSQAIK